MLERYFVRPCTVARIPRGVKTVNVQPARRRRSREAGESRRPEAEEPMGHRAGVAQKSIQSFNTVPGPHAELGA